MQITKLGGHKKSDEKVRFRETESKEIFCKRILTIRGEGGNHYRRMLDVMKSRFVLTTIIRNPDEDNKEISGNL